MMRQIYLVSALLLCHPVSSERDADCSAKLTPEAEMKCKRAKRKASSLSDSMSLTTRVNNDILLHIKRFEDEPEKTPGELAEFQKVVMQTILAFVKLMTIKKANVSLPNITEGISTMGIGLWTCILFFIPQNVQQDPLFHWFHRIWTGTFDSVGKVQAEEIQSRIAIFNENGQGYEIAHVVYLCVDETLELIEKFVSHNVADKIIPWFTGVKATTKGVARSWEAIANGEPEKAAEVVYFAIREASDAVLPESVKNHGSYKIVTGVLDEQIGNLNQYVMGFKKKLKESSICIRNDITRNSSRPKICPPPEDTGGTKFSLYNGRCVDLMAKARCPSLIQQWESGKREEVMALTRECPPLSLPPSCAFEFDKCPFDGEHQQCLADCVYPYGVPKSKNFCWQDCPQGFPHVIDGNRKCARTETAWDELNMEKLAKAAKTVMNIVTTIFAFVNGEEQEGIQSLNNVFKSGVEFAQTFTFANCEMPKEIVSIVC